MRPRSTEGARSPTLPDIQMMRVLARSPLSAQPLIRVTVTPRPRVPPTSVGPRLAVGPIPASVRLRLDRLREGRVSLGDLAYPLPGDAEQLGSVGGTQGVHDESEVSEVARRAADRVYPRSLGHRLVG